MIYGYLGDGDKGTRAKALGAVACVFGLPSLLDIWQGVALTGGRRLFVDLAVS